MAITFCPPEEEEEENLTVASCTFLTISSSESGLRASRPPDLNLNIAGTPGGRENQGLLAAIETEKH